MLKFEDKNQDGLIQYDGYKTNEMIKVDRDIMVLANPEIAGLPNWVIALVAAGGLAAALSTAAGLLLAISSAISHDLLKGVFRPDISGRKTPFNKSCEIADEIASSNPAAVDKAAAKPPAATNAITQLGSPAISGFAKTIISRSTFIISFVLYPSY